MVEINRRAFFAALLAPFLAKLRGLLPKPTPRQMVIDAFGENLRQALDELTAEMWPNPLDARNWGRPVLLPISFYEPEP